MKTIGLLGGMSWESTADYYRIINEEIRAALGGSHSARVLMYSYDFQEIETLQREGDWDAMRRSLFDVGRRLKAAGADFAALCTNTMHKVMDGFEEETGLPLLHIVDVAGEALSSLGIRRVGLLGTRFTMEEPFYRERLERGFGIEVLVPDAAGRRAVDGVIFGELVRGVVRDESKRAYALVMDDLVARGADGILLGCTEIGMLVKEYASPLFDTTILHAKEAARLSLE